MLDPYGPPLGHGPFCPCDACLEVRQAWADRQPALDDGLPLADAEDTADDQPEPKELS